MRRNEPCQYDHTSPVGHLHTEVPDCEGEVKLYPCGDRCDAHKPANTQNRKKDTK